MWDCPDSQEVGLEAATLERVRNSSLVECPRADNGAGLKPFTDTVDAQGLPLRVVGERSAAEKGDLGRLLEPAEERMPV